MEVVGDHLGRAAFADDAAAVDLDRTVAHLRDRRELVGDEDHRASGVSELLHPAETAPLELCVANGQHLVDEEDLGFQMRSDGESEAHVHAARVPLHGRVDELLHT